MTTTTIGGPLPGDVARQKGLFSFLLSKWAEYRLLRSIESVPYDVMKDVGFPAAERANER